MYTCSNNQCGHTSKSFFGLCPICKDGMGEESSSGNSNVVKSSGSKTLVAKGSEIEDYEIGVADSNFEESEVVRKTEFEDFNTVLSKEGGFVKDQVIAMGAQPGTGKSTFCAQISKSDTLYITTEESLNQVKSRFHRVNPNSGASIVSKTDLNTILHIIENTDKDFVIVDSLNAINNGADGYVRQASNLVKITGALKNGGKAGIIISQVTKSGEITGMNTILHAVDTVIYMDKSEFQDMIIVGSTKNRFGEVGSVAIFEHEGNGLKQSKDVTIDSIDDMTGVTITTCKFGHKNIDVAIEALVAPSSMNYGLRRANGVNQARVQQIIGVLSNNSKIDFSSKDVYVSVSSGLNVTDVAVDLAIANSILSSYYKIPSKYPKLKGIVSLNGSVRKSEEITHIKDLIKEFKRAKDQGKAAEVRSVKSVIKEAGGN